MGQVIYRIGAVALAAPFATGISFSAQEPVPNSAAEAVPLSVGASAPDAALRAMDGKAVSLRSILSHKKSVVIFYRGGWCPYCNAHLSDLATIEGDVRRRGYQIIAISPDTPENLGKMSDKDHLNFKLLSDSTAEAMKRFGVAYRLDDGTYGHMRTTFNIDLEAYSGQTHHILPVPSVFIVNKAGKITFVHANPDFKVRLKAAEVLAAIDSN